MATRSRFPWPGTEDLRAVAALEGPVVSLFVPVTAAVPDVQQNAVRHERVVKSALARLEALEVDESAREQAREALGPFAREDAAPAARIAARAAYWCAETGLRTFGLPFSVAEDVRVAWCAAVRPVARAAALQHRFRVLRLSANQVELFEGDAEGLEAVKAPGLPKSLEDALGRELDDASLQLHSTSRGGDQAVFHGHGGAPRGREIDLERFHQHVARGLEAEIGGDAVPLLLAADVRHRSGLAQALRRDVGLLEPMLEGNAERLSVSALHEKTHALLVEHRRTQHADRDPSDAPPITQISEIARLAVMGRIARLRVPEHGRIPGRLDPATGRAAEAWADDDLIESLAAEVIRRGGEVEVAEDETFSAESDVLGATLR